MRSTLPTFNEVWQQQLAERLTAQVAACMPQTRFVVACSGGVDSLLLLYVMAALFPTRLYCIYIDHQLQSASRDWGQQVAAHAARLNLNCYLHAVNVAQGNLEQQARAARYAAFAQVLDKDDVLLTAHHQQDQAETVVLRLLQGSGAQGLAGMLPLSQRNGLHIWRPLLDLSRAQIEMWALQCGIVALQDPMNNELQYDRVWCRQQLWPMLTARFPQMQNAIARSAALLHDAQQIVDEVCQQDLVTCGNTQHIHLKRLAILSAPRQRQLLSKWMQGDAVYRPALHVVEALQYSVIESKTDAQALLDWHGIQFRRYQHQLFRLDVAQQRDCAPVLSSIEAYYVQPDQPFYAASACFMWQKQAQQIGLSEQLLGQALQLKVRVGGERVHLWGRVGHWPLKKAIQAAQILPWFRHTIQILYCDNVILGVFTPTGFWLAHSAYCQAQGWLPVLQHSPHPLPNLLTHFERDHDSTKL